MGYVVPCYVCFLRMIKLNNVVRLMFFTYLRCSCMWFGMWGIDVIVGTWFNVSKFRL